MNVDDLIVKLTALKARDPDNGHLPVVINDHWYGEFCEHVVDTVEIEPSREDNKIPVVYLRSIEGKAAVDV